jgi:type IV secretory pathway VirD2 relaxase
LSDFQTVHGFEDVWRAPVARQVRPSLGRVAGPVADVRARLARVASHAPEVMVKVTGRTRDPAHLRAHLDYISRNGELQLEDQDGAVVAGRGGVRELATDWSALQLADSSTRTTAPFSRSIVLSMPAGTDPVVLRDAARAFAADMFAGQHAYVFTLHTDTARPHVHLSICSRGYMGERLNPKKADLELWRQSFAQRLRERGVEAEATPRRARGVARKPERTPVRKITDRHQAGLGSMARVRQDAYREAARAAFQGDTQPREWERKTVVRQATIRQTYLAQARLLQSSPAAADRALGDKVEAFVRTMPTPVGQRLALARELREAGRARPDRGRER